MPAFLFPLTYNISSLQKKPQLAWQRLYTLWIIWQNFLGGKAVMRTRGKQEQLGYQQENNCLTDGGNFVRVCVLKTKQG